MKKIQIISFTAAGFALSERMKDALKNEYETGLNTTKEDVYENAVGRGTSVRLVSEGLKNWCQAVFYEADALIFIGASGIAVRTIAPFVVSKTKDPAVLVADECGRHVISLLSGHLGGGNELTEFLAKRINAEPVITTASDVNGKLAVDVWAKKNHLVISDMKKAKLAAAEIVSGKQLALYCEGEVRGTLPPELRLTKQLEDSDIAVSIHDNCPERALQLMPKAVILGIGCKKEKPYDEIKDSVFRILEEYGISSASIAKMASIDLKAEEPGLLQLAEKLQVPFAVFSAETLMEVPGEYEASGFVQKITGVDNVCERAAMAACDREEQETAQFICRKTAANGVTVALLSREWSVSFE